MAQRHVIQDSADLSGSKALFRDELHPAIVLGLGVNVWVTHVLLALVSYGATPLQHVVGACSLLCLLLGVATRMTKERESSRRAARWLLLCVYPALIALSLSLGSEQIRESAYTALSMPLCAASLLAYAAAAVVACRQQEQPLETESHALNGREPIPTPSQLRRFVIGLCLSGALAIAVIAPLSTDHAQLAEAWGDAADAGAVLSALAAAAIAVSVIVVHLGGALRKSEKPRETMRQRRQRIATLVFLTLLGFVTYFTVVP
jgi:heme A synthase